MSQGPSEPGPTVSGGPGDEDQDNPRLPAREQVTRPMVRPVLPAHQPTEVAPSYQPTEVAPSYQPTEVAPSYQPTEVAPSYQPTEVAPSHQPTEVAPSHEPTQIDPRLRDASPRSDPTVIAPQARPNADPRQQATVMPAGPFAPPVPPTGFDPGSPLAPVPSASPQSPDLMRYGPGVPPSQAGVADRAAAGSAPAPGPVPSAGQPRADRDPARGGRGAAIPAVQPRAVQGDRRADPDVGRERVHGERDRAYPHQRLVWDDLVPVGVHPAVGGAATAQPVRGVRAARRLRDRGRPGPGARHRFGASHLADSRPQPRERLDRR